MATEEQKPLMDRVLKWVQVEKDTARRMQDGPRLEANRQLYWKIRYETLADVYYRLTEKLDI